MDRGHEKLGVALFAGAAIKGILTDALVWESVLIGGMGFILLAVSIFLSREV